MRAHLEKDLKALFNDVVRRIDVSHTELLQQIANISLELEHDGSPLDQSMLDIVEKVTAIQAATTVFSHNIQQLTSDYNRSNARIDASQFALSSMVTRICNCETSLTNLLHSFNSIEIEIDTTQTTVRTLHNANYNEIIEHDRILQQLRTLSDDFFNSHSFA